MPIRYTAVFWPLSEENEIPRRTTELECFRVSGPEVDDSSCGQSGFMEDQGVGTQPVLLGSGFSDVVNLHEQDARVAGGQRMKGLWNPTHSQLSNP